MTEKNLGPGPDATPLEGDRPQVGTQEFDAWLTTPEGRAWYVKNRAAVHEQQDVEKARRGVIRQRS